MYTRIQVYTCRTAGAEEVAIRRSLLQRRVYCDFEGALRVRETRTDEDISSFSVFSDSDKTPLTITSPNVIINIP